MIHFWLNPSHSLSKWGFWQSCKKFHNYHEPKIAVLSTKGYIFYRVAFKVTNQIQIR